MSTAFAICEDCGTVTEFHDQGIEGRLQAWQSAKDFKPEKTTIEIRGHCKDCS
jgi:Fur family zinc uptake transcriptional regulator